MFMVVVGLLAPTPLLRLHVGVNFENTLCLNAFVVFHI